MRSTSYPPGMHCRKAWIRRCFARHSGHIRPGERLAGHTDSSRATSIGWKLRKCRANVYCVVHVALYNSVLTRHRADLVCVSYAASSPVEQLIHFNIPSCAPARSDTAETATQAFDSRRILHRINPLPGASANPFQAQQVTQPADATCVFLESATLASQPLSNNTELHQRPCSTPLYAAGLRSHL